MHNTGSRRRRAELRLTRARCMAPLVWGCKRAEFESRTGRISDDPCVEGLKRLYLTFHLNCPTLHITIVNIHPHFQFNKTTAIYVNVKTLNINTTELLCVDSRENMSLTDIEFINPECVEIKNEAIKEDINEDGVDFPFNTNDGGAKCGEIFTANNVDFTLFCTFCRGTYNTLNDFGEHLRLKHESAEDVFDQPYSKYESEHEFEPQDIETTEVDNGDEFSEADEKPLKETRFTCDHCNKCYRYKLSFQRHKCRGAPNNRKEKAGSQNRVEESPLRETVGFKDESMWDHHDDEGGSTSESQLNEEAGIESKFNKLESGCDMCGDAEANERHECEAKKGESGRDADYEMDVPNPELFCDICHRQFKYKNVFRRHGMQHEVGPLALRRDPNYRKCVDCDIEFANNADWLEHETNHPKVKPFQCSYCQKKFKTNAELEAHTKNHTIEGPVKCDQCGADFVRYKNLISHINRVHLQVKPFACTLCDKKFPQNAELRVHMRRHTGEKPYQCEECGQSFMVAAKLNEHLKRHAGVRDVQCPVCPMAFVTKKMLRKHMVKHSTERPHVCSTCGNTFSRRKALLAHIKIHQDVKEYVCTLCGKAFAQHAGLYMHKKTHLND